MDRLACVDLPSLALQLLLREHPEWSSHPAAVVQQDRPQGRILEINELARRCRVLPGMRYAAGLSLAPGLRAAVVQPSVVSGAVQALTALLRRFSPNVEPSSDEPGVLWVDARGLQRLWPSLSAWGAAIAEQLRADGWHASVVVGFSRFSTYAIARAQQRNGRRLVILGDSEQERRLCATVTLDRLNLPSKARDGLAQLGICTVDDLLRLPSGGVMRRFGGEAQRLWRLAAGDHRPKLRPVAAQAPVQAKLHLDHGTASSSTLLFLVKRLLTGLVATLAQRHEVLAALELDLVLDGGRRLSEQLQPAEATLDEGVICDLVRLRLDSLKLPALVMDIEVRARAVAATTAQLRMHFDRPRRDLGAAHAALARLRAELGDGAVQRAVLHEGHLPEAQFRWQPLDKLPARAALASHQPAAGEDSPSRSRSLVRRILTHPQLLPPQPRHVRNDGWLVRGLPHGSVIESTGPYLVSGGWWQREIHREYQFVQTQRGDLLWLFYDRHRRRWFIQGMVQ